MKRVTIADAPAFLNMNDKAIWVLGFNEAQLTDAQITTGIAAANSMAGTFDFGDGSTAVEREAACVKAFREAAGGMPVVQNDSPKGGQHG